MPEDDKSETQDLTRRDLFELDKDDVLAELVDMINSAEAGVKVGIDVTLFVRGQIVSGMLISGAEYFDKYGEFFAAGQDDEDTRARVKEYFGGRAKLYGPRESEGQPADLPNFIHLAEARAFAAGGKPIPANHGVIWRGRLSSVDGFALGRLVAEEIDG